MNEYLELILWILAIPLSIWLTDFVICLVKEFMFYSYHPRRKTPERSEISKCVGESEEDNHE